MQNLLDKTVEVKTKEGVMTGKLYDYTADGKTVWIETEEDIYPVKNFDSITEVEDEAEETEHPIFTALDALGYNYDVFYDEEEGFDILISGFTYTVSVQQDGEYYYCFTTHRERYKKEEEELYEDTRKADGNARKIKKLETVIRYVEKWVEK